ncbi:hypothetical protein L7F22_054350 [Adiantum nelumboides]|nr:hypothetical protein [Adiantum nelumboides]
MSTESSEDDSDSTQSYPGAAAQGIVDSFPHVLAVAALQQAIQPRRRLQFNPLPSRPNNRRVPPNRPLNMAAAARADLRVKFGSFSGKSKEDPDCHVAQFETRWQARGFAGVYDAQAKMRQFEATFEGKAVQWFSNFDVAHFSDYEELKTAFLNRFRVEKTANDVLTKLKEVRQKKMFVEDYAQKFNRYVRRLTPQERPTDEIEVAAECEIACDCSECVEQESEAMAVTRSKAKLKSPLDWEEQKDIREEVTEEILNDQKEEGKHKRKKRMVEKEEQEEDKSEALFKEMLNSPLTFTLDQLLSLVPMFRDRMYSTILKSRISGDRPLFEQSVCSALISPEDVDFQVPTVSLEFDSRKFSSVFLDGGSGVNILAESEFLKMKNARLEPAPFQVRMADQSRVQPIGILRKQSLIIQGLQFPVNFVVLRMKENLKAYSMLLGRPWFRTAKLKQDWEKNMATLKKGKKVITIAMGEKQELSSAVKPIIAQPISFAEEVGDEEEDRFLDANPTVVPVFEVNVEQILERYIVFPEAMGAATEDSTGKGQKKQLLEQSGTAMTKTRAMKETLKELKEPATEVQQLSDDEVDEEAQSDETELIEGLDLHDEETKVWLQRIGLYEFAHLPWEEWQQNTYAEQQMQCLRDNKGYITEDTEVTTKMVAEVFKLPNKQGAKLRKMTDSIMKGEFGPPEGTRSYYMVRNADKLRCRHLFWYLEKICLLAKTSYMSKEAFMPIWNAERGVAVDWAGILFDRMQIAEARDKRRSPSLTKLVPYLGAIFSYVLQVPMGSVVYPEVTKRRKLEYEFPSGSKMKTINQIEWVASESSKSEVQPVDSKFMFSSLPKISQSGHKPKVFTFRPGKVEEKIDVGKPVFNMAKSFISPTRSQDSLPGIFSAQEAVNSLAELGRFINNQEAMILTMGAKTAKVEQVERLEKQVMVLNDQLDMVKKDKVELEQRLAVADGKLQERMEDVLQSALEFGGWADGLKMSVDEQFTLFGERMAQLISDNNFLMNRLTPLMEMEKAALEGQSVSGVLVAEGELDVLKREVQQYTQELWNGATGVFQQHLTKPIDKFQLWFEAAGEQKIRDENVGLKRMVEDLKMQLETEQSINAVVQQKLTTEDDEAKASQMTKVVEEAVTIQSAEAEKNKDEANTDQGIVNPRSA